MCRGTRNWWRKWKPGDDVSSSRSRCSSSSASYRRSRNSATISKVGFPHLVMLFSSFWSICEWQHSTNPSSFAVFSSQKFEEFVCFRNTLHNEHQHWPGYRHVRIDRLGRRRKKEKKAIRTSSFSRSHTTIPSSPISFSKGL